MKACEAGGSDAVPMACNARICSVAAPFHQCLTHQLPGLECFRYSGERVSPQRLAGCTSDQKRELEGSWRQSRLIVRTRECGRCSDGACLRARLALIFGKAKRCRSSVTHASVTAFGLREAWRSVSPWRSRKETLRRARASLRSRWPPSLSFFCALIVFRRGSLTR